ncbi:hypothetical protein [Sinomicrobium sp. M5D2P9]
MKKYLILIIFCFIGCHNSTKELVAIREGIEIKMKEWDVESEISLAEEKKMSVDDNAKRLTILINLKIDKDNNYNSEFVTVLADMINESFYQEFERYEEIIYNFSFEGLVTLPNTEPFSVEDYKISMKREFLKENHQKFIESPLYHDFVEHTIKNIRAPGVQKIDAWIRFLSSEEVDLIDFKGDFWDLIYKYAEVCSGHGTSGSPVYNLMVVGNAACDPENEDAISPEKLYYYIESCSLDINPQWIKLPLEEMLNKLNTHFAPNEE